MNTLSRLASWVIAISVLFSSLSVSAAVTTSAGLQREAKPIIKNISNSTGKSWATARVKLYADTLKYMSKINTLDAKNYKKEVWESASRYISNLQNGVYVFDITPTDRTMVENLVLSYQKDMTRAVRTYIEQYKNSDKKEIGDMHFTLRSTNTSVDIDIGQYRVVQSQDMRNMEIDIRMSIRVTGKDGNLSATLEGNMMIVDNALYLTLRDYSLSTTIKGMETTEIEKVLRTVKGKTYHQKLDKEVADALKESKKSLEMTEKLLSILESESIFTPVAKEGSEYILMFRKSAVQKIVALSRTPSMLDISPKNLLIPMDIRTNGKDIDMSGYANSLSLDAHISRKGDGTPVMTLEWTERSGYDSWNWKLSKTPTFWAFAGASEEYTIDAQATKNGATATVKKWDKTIGTARINSTGVHAWTYDMSAIYEDISYDWETGESTSEDISMKFWWAVKQEFGRFTLTPPTLYEEMSKLQKQLEDL